MTGSVALAVYAAGGCVVAWFTGFAYGRLKRFIIRMIANGAR